MTSAVDTPRTSFLEEIVSPESVRRMALSEMPDLRLEDGRICRPAMHKVRGMPPGALLYAAWAGPKNLSVILTIEDDPAIGLLVHTSLAYPGHLPSWRDVREVRYAIYPDTMDVMMILPRKENYVNVHQYCFQMYNTPAPWSLAR